MSTLSPAERALFHMLTVDTQIADVVGKRVSPLVLDQELELPAITYELSSSRPMSTLDGASTIISLDFDIFAMAESFGAASDLGEEIRKCLSGRRGSISVGGIVFPQFQLLGCTHTNGRTSYSPPVDGGRTGVYMRMLSFLMTYRANTVDN